MEKGRWKLQILLSRVFISKVAFLWGKVRLNSQILKSSSFTLKVAFSGEKGEKIYKYYKVAVTLNTVKKVKYINVDFSCREIKKFYNHWNVVVCY